MSPIKTAECEHCHKAIPEGTPQEHVGTHYFHPHCLVEHLLAAGAHHPRPKPQETRRWRLFRREK
jgi:hypothetical protein